MVALQGVVVGNHVRCNIWGSSERSKREHLLCNLLWKLFHLLFDVTNESITWPSSNEHDGIDRGTGKVHHHHCSWLKRMSANFMCFKAEGSASNCCTCCLEGSKYLVWGYLFQSVISPYCIDRCVLRCAWICSDLINEVCPLQNRAKVCIICSSVNDCLVFLVIFLHFKSHHPAVWQFQTLRWRQKWAADPWKI